MRNIPDAQFEGFVIHDPSIKKAKSGKHVCEFSIAVNQYSKSEETPKVSYIDIEIWDKLAEICAARVNKGKMVMVAGELRQDRWEKEGKVRSRLKLIGSRLRFIEYQNVLEAS